MINFLKFLNLKTVEGQNIKDLEIKSLGYLYRRSKEQLRKKELTLNLRLRLMIENANQMGLLALKTSSINK